MSCFSIQNIRHYCHVKTHSCREMKRCKIFYHDITLVLKGQIEYYVDDQYIVLKSGDILYVPYGSYRKRMGGNEYVDYISFNFQMDSNDPLPFESHMKQYITPDVKLLLSVYKDNHLTESANSVQKCEAILNYIILHLMSHKQAKMENKYVRQIIEYINDHIYDPICLEEISKRVNLSKIYCVTLFKKETHQTIGAYITNKRINLAKKLILENEMTLTQISEYLGFSDYNYFSRLFKKQVGVSPRNYFI